MGEVDFSLVDRLLGSADRNAIAKNGDSMEGVRGDLERVRGDLYKMDASIKTWMLATMVTIIASMLAAIFGMSQLFRGAASQPPQAPAPIIIQVPQAAAPVAPVAQPQAASVK